MSLVYVYLNKCQHKTCPTFVFVCVYVNSLHEISWDWLLAYITRLVFFSLFCPSHGHGTFIFIFWDDYIIRYFTLMKMGNIK